MAFVAALGFEFNVQFTDDKAACMVVSDEAFVMLLSEPDAAARSAAEPEEKDVSGIHSRYSSWQHLPPAARSSVS
jgi:hypothetical protein